MILLVAYGGGHVAALAPVAATLQADGRPFVFLALTTAFAHLQQLSIPAIGFKDLPGARDDDVLAYGEHLASELPASSVVSREETVAYLGLSFRDLVLEHGESTAWELYRTRGRQAFLPVRTLRAAIEQLRPSLVLATNSPRAERAAIMAAGQCGVPAVCHVDLFGTQEIQWIGQPGYGERVCVLNKEVKRQFVDFGRGDDEVIVTGNPAFDELRDAAVIAEGEALRAARGWSDERITVLWASSVEPERHPFTGQAGDPSLTIRIEAYLRQLVAGSDRYRLVVRYHPSEHTRFVEQPNVYFSPTTESLGALLHAVDIVVVTASTVGLQASLAGRPVIAGFGSVFEADAPYGRMGIATGLAVIDSIAATLEQLSGRVVRGQHGDVSSGTAASATRRVLAVVDDVLLQKGGGPQ